MLQDTYVFTGEQANLVKELFCQLPDQKTALTHEEAAFLCAALTSGMDGNSSQVEKSLPCNLFSKVCPVNQSACAFVSFFLVSV